jgi:O-antigen biosynthesis protein
MSKKKSAVYRGVRKGAYLSRKVLSKGANFSGRVEQKADRMIHGTDPVSTIHDKVLFEKIFADALPEIVPIHPSMPLAGRKASITLLIPSLQKSSFFGGTATALIFAGMLAKEKNMPLRIVETLVHGKLRSSDLADFFESNGIDLTVDELSLLNLAGRKYNHYGYLDIHPEDIYVASAWWDAHLLQQLPLLKKFIYLIQDYEPIFYNNSDQYVYAEATYHSESFIPVCNTKLMLDFMECKGYEYIAKNALYFEPAVGINYKSNENNKNKSTDKRRIFIYGRPSVHRNLFYSALDAVNEVFGTNQLDSSEWEVFMAGQNNIPDILLDGGVTVKNLGKLSMEEYHEFAKTIDIAVSLMLAPHPSYPPLELASLGAKVVTTSYETKQDLSKYSKNIIVVKPKRDQITKAIISSSKSKNINDMANISSDWHEALRKPIRNLSSLL